VTESDHPFRRLSPLTPLVRGSLLVAAVVFTTWDDLLAGNLGPIGLLLLGVLGAGAVLGYASWLRTKYWVEADELRVDTGVVYHQSRRIRIDRLQGIDIVQPFVARIFGLAELKMDVAGGDREGSLAYLPLVEAQQLRELLLARRDAVRRAAAPAATPAGDATGDAATEGPALPDWAPPDHDIAALDLRTLVLSMLLSWEAIGLVVGVVVFGVLSQLSAGALLVPVVPVLGGFALVQARKLSAFYGFTVAQTRAGLQVRRGLLERSTQTIALTRVQGVLISEPVLWRRMGWARLDVSVAGYGNADDSEGRPASTTVMPVAPRALVMDLARHLLRGDDQDAEVDPEALVLTPPPPAARWLDPVARRVRGAGLGADVVASREGWLTRRTHVMRHARVQSLRLSQGPLQRRLGLADLHVDSPPGPVHVRARHRLVAEARSLLEQESALAGAARKAAG
jgi:putative membrane protein